MTECLETCKLALDRGLITTADYDAVKTAFLKAQQIKAGLEAGFIREEDYESVKSAFLRSMLDTLAGSAATSGLQTALPADFGEQTTNGAPSPQPRAINASVPPSPAVAPAPRPAPIEAPLPAVVASAEPSPAARDFAAPATAPMAAAAAPSPTSDVPARTRSGAVVPTPSNIPKLGGQKTVTNAGTSISGITISEDAINLYYHMKAKGKYRWATWRIDNGGKMVVIDEVGDKESTWNEFLSCLPPNDCRFAVFDYPYTNSEGITYSKIVFLNWAPDTANIRSKMMYASTKDHFKNYLDGISVEYQASELDEVQEGEVQASVANLVVRK